MSEELFKMDEFFTWVARTDREFLNLLLKQGESQRLDFKQKLDLSDNKAKLEFVKDVISMANRAPGGHLVIGVCDDGTPTTH